MGERKRHLACQTIRRSRIMSARIGLYIIKCSVILSRNEFKGPCSPKSRWFEFVIDAYVGGLDTLHPRTGICTVSSFTAGFTMQFSACFTMQFSACFTLHAFFACWPTLPVSTFLEEAVSCDIDQPYIITRGGPCHHGFMCGCKQWSNDINESN